MQRGLSPSLGAKVAKASKSGRKGPSKLLGPSPLPSTRSTEKATAGRILALPGLIKKPLDESPSHFSDTLEFTGHFLVPVIAENLTSLYQMRKMGF